jgi:AraC-like DNA-binding protein
LNEDIYALVQAEESPGTIHLSYGSETFEKDTKVTFHEKQEFLGLIFNLGSDLHYTLDQQQRVIYWNCFDMIYIPAGYRFPCQVMKGEASSFCIHFPQKYMKVWQQNFPFISEVLKVMPKKPFTTGHGSFPITPEIHQIILDVMLTQSTGLLRSAYCNSRVCQVGWHAFHQVSEMIAEPVKKTTRRSTTEKVKQVREWLVADLKKDWSLNRLSQMTGLERSKLNREFRKVYNISLMRYLFEERMQKAKALFRDTDMLVKQVASDTGYKNISRFSEAFKRRFGFSPGVLRSRDS